MVAVHQGQSKWIAIPSSQSHCTVRRKAYSRPNGSASEIKSRLIFARADFVSATQLSRLAVAPVSQRPVVDLIPQWTRSKAYRLSNERSASSTVDPIPTIPSATLDPRNATHNSLRSDNCG